MSPSEYKDTLIKQIDDAIAKFNRQIPAIEREVAAQVSELIRDIELKNGRIANTAANLRKIGQLKNLIEKAVLTGKYMSSVQEFVNAFEKVIALQDTYFKLLTPDYSPSRFIKEVRKTAIDATISSLTGSGMEQALVEPIRKILQQNITAGATFGKLLEQVRSFILGSGQFSGKPSALSAYARRITVNAINQYSRLYGEAVARDLGMHWRQYTGSLKATSRIFCQAMVKKRWFHLSEIPDLLKGNFQEFKDLDGKINTKTGLPEGLIEGTNPDTFLTNLGGWECGHQAIPVPDNMIPLNLRAKFKSAA